MLRITIEVSDSNVCRVSAPNDHHRTCPLWRVQETIFKVIDDYGKWIIALPPKSVEDTDGL